ncbi:hypothetical protein JCM10213_007155 [Rhodosporidiobolus nylandii]
MRESNFNSPAYGRACITISSGLYDRRALDAPAASLPLVNSLHHLAHLTATSPRIREILAGDGGLERLIRILKYCAAGGPAVQQQPTALVDVKGKGRELPRVARKNPFKAFAEYDLLPSLEDLREVEDADVDGALFLAQGGDPSSLSSGRAAYTYAVPPSLLLPHPQKPRHFVYTYLLAFQCIVNIGVRGNEAIRSRVVEAGALDVVVFILERYLEELERRRVQNFLEWRRGEEERLRELEARRLREEDEDADGAVPMQEDPTLLPPPPQELDLDLLPDSTSAFDLTLPLPSTSSSVDVSPLSSVPVSPMPPASPVASSPSAAVAAVSTPTVASRPLLTRLNVVAASSSGGALMPPSRVHTPDTVMSLDESSSLTGAEEDGSQSGQEADEDMVAVPSSSSSATPARVRSSLGGVGVGVGAKPDVTSSPAEEARQDAMDVDGSESRESTDREDEPVQPRQQPSRRPRAHSHAHATPRAPVPSPAVPPPLPRPSQAGFSPSPPPAPLAPAPDTHPLHFRDEDALLSLQLLAYLSKYPHVRTALHAPSPACRAATAYLPPPCASSSSSSARRPVLPPTNVFSLVESFTYRAAPSPSSSGSSSSSSAPVDPFTPPLPDEVQFWASVIMRNACRKDDKKGGVRRCANMRCGRWEQKPRQFAKCRRCRRAKYCSKECQSEAWCQGHRYWCHKVGGRRRSERAEGAALEGAAAADSLPTSGAEGVATPNGEDMRRRRHRHAHGHGHGHEHGSRRRRGGGGEAGGDDDDEDDDEDLPPPPAPVLGGDATTPRANALPLPLDRDPTLRPHDAGPDGTATPPPPTAPGVGVGVAVAGEDVGLFGAPWTGGGGGMGAMVDEEQVARGMVLGAGMGDEDGLVRVAA